MSQSEVEALLDNYSKKQKEQLDKKKGQEREYLRAKVLKNW